MAELKPHDGETPAGNVFQRIPRHVKHRASQEWIGGRFPAPFYVRDREAPYRPDLVLWMELPDGFIVGQAVVGPEDTEGALARTLRGAMTQPGVGPPRRPTSIRVADAATAAEVRAEIDRAIPVTVAATPELDALVEHMIETLPPDEEDQPSYFAGGKVSAAAVEKLFAASRRLFAAKPWAVAGDTQVLRMDIPALGVKGACLSVIGELGESRGVLIFASLDGFESFLETAESGDIQQGRIALSSGWLALSFESAADLPPSMRREAMKHGWPVADADAYPVVDRRDPDGMSRPLIRRDVQIATACALALTAFFGRHAGMFESDTPANVSESYLDNEGREVQLTAPYEGFDDWPADADRPEDLEEPALDDDATPEPFRPRANRNAPCPCGSGRKYKKCHLAADEAEHAARQATALTHTMAHRLVVRLEGFALREYGYAWEAFQDLFFDVEDALDLAIPWSVYCFEVDGRTVADAYLDRHRRRCSPEELRWLDAQRAAWLSVWEVEKVDPGQAVTLRDLLSHELRTVSETRASKTLVARDAVLGRIVDHDGVSLLCGVHPRPLPPFYAAEAVGRARKRLRRKRAVPVDRLRDATFGRHLIRYWEETAFAFDAESAAPPRLHNTDGDPFLLTVDHYACAPDAAREVDARIGKLDGAQREPDEDGATAWLFMRPDDQQTLIGRVRMRRSELRIETNSLARADVLRERIEGACGARIRHRAREHAAPLALGRDSGHPPQPPAPPSPEEERLVAEFKARHYADWADVPLPALGDRTPRECAQTAAGRAEVDLLLKDMENMECRTPGTPFDFSDIRRELGIGRRPQQRNQAGHATKRR